MLNTEQEYEAWTALLNLMTSFNKRDPWNDMRFRALDYVSVHQTDQQKIILNTESKYFITYYIISQ